MPKTNKRVKTASPNTITCDVLSSMLSNSQDSVNGAMLLDMKIQGDYTCSIEDENGETKITFVDYFNDPDEDKRIEITSELKQSLVIDSDNSGISSINFLPVARRKGRKVTENYDRISKVIVTGSTGLDATSFNNTEEPKGHKNKEYLPALANTYIDCLSCDKAALVLRYQKIRNCIFTENSMIFGMQNTLIDNLVMWSNFCMFQPTLDNALIYEVYVRAMRLYHNCVVVTNLKRFKEWVADSIEAILGSFRFIKHTKDFDDVNIHFGSKAVNFELVDMYANNDLGYKPFQYSIYIMSNTRYSVADFSDMFTGNTSCSANSIYGTYKKNSNVALEIIWE